MKPIKVKMKTSGEWRFVTRNPDGSIGDDTGWFPNLVTDLGLLQMTTQAGWANRFSVGSSGAAHNTTDTALTTFLAADNNQAFSNAGINLGFPDYQTQTTRQRRFDGEDINDTVREVGLSNTSNNTNMSILNSVTPNITVSPVQTLDVFYRITMWPNLDDATGITNIFGDDYDYTVRMGNLGDFEEAFGTYVPRTSAAAYSGDIGLNTGLPSGSSDGSTSVTVTSQGSGFCNYTIFFSIDDGNFGGIQSIASAIISAGGVERIYIQVEFKNRGLGTGALDSPIPKDETREISFFLAMTWDRH